MINPFKILPIVIFIGFLACHSKVRPSESKNTNLTASASENRLMVSSKEDSTTIRQSISIDTIPSTSVTLDTCRYPLLSHLASQQMMIRKHSQKDTDHQFVPDGKFTYGNFEQGAIDVIFNSIDGEPWHFYGYYGQVGNEEDKLEFIVYGMTAEKVDQYKKGYTYRIYWAETIYFMEPFDDGYQRRYIVYRVEP